MIPFSGIKAVWLSKYYIDFRKGHDGLLSEAYNLALDPFAGDLLIFVAKDRRKLKMIYSDDNGLWIAYKKFNSGRMKTLLEIALQPSMKKIAFSELSLLIEGASYSRGPVTAKWPEAE